MTQKLNPFAALAAENFPAPDAPPSPIAATHPGGAAPATAHPATHAPAAPVIPGEIIYGESDIIINEGAEITTLRVTNTADRPIQVGSHFHFAEVNDALKFDREAAWGKRLAVLSGGAERFEPGAVEEVRLVPIGGKRIVLGLRGLCGGELDNANR